MWRWSTSWSARSCWRRDRPDRGLAGPATALGFAFALLLGATMIYCFWLLLTTAAFWIVRMDEIHELWHGIYDTGRWPVTIYPGWLGSR